MLSRDLRELSATFDDWCAGRSTPNDETWFGFQRDLKTCVAKAALLEFGISVNVLDLGAELLKPDTNVRLLPTPAQRQQRKDHGGAP